ncbi:MAG: DUF1003 domain-containing protein [Actinobacteria bacterium]|uniref:Unannotated protein n=1 Tax=freshwater metagenome TaxID=449393 RepID=A0A6J6CDT6_9ZZZZ|nr:DUF1003 domain-containing protein [Actinomycetota bacterium]MTA90190.1 DUF1003 domain-containing protein [Actinomycetota bacterium]
MTNNESQLESPLGRRSVFRLPYVDHETVGRISERFARAMGTGIFLIGMTIFIAIWISWNTLAPAGLQFDPRALNFTLLTLLLSMQASYAAPLILLAQNREADRDRVKFEQDRQRAEQNLADTEYLAREVAALRLALEEIATKDEVRDEIQKAIREVLDEVKPRKQKKSK